MTDIVEGLARSQEDFRDLVASAGDYPADIQAIIEQTAAALLRIEAGDDDG